MDDKPTMSPNLYGLSVEEIAAIPVLENEARFRATQIARWLYLTRAETFDEMTNLSQTLRRSLAAQCRIERIALKETLAADDDTATKYLFALDERTSVEAVWIRDAGRHTLCVSSQAGCAYGCTFCATASMRAGRNLTPGEILAQIETLRDEMSRGGFEETPNIVFMGMGEPLANYDALVRSLRLICGNPGFRMAARRITVSTIGLIPEIERLAAEPLAVRLAFSLNATTDDLRSSLMPVNKKYPFRKVFEVLRAYQRAKEEAVTLEYVLLKGINDSPADGKRLGQFANSLQCKVNLIAYNPHQFAPYEPSTDAEIEAFRSSMLPYCPQVTITVRWSRGREIKAACGQLSTLHGAQNEEPATS